MAVLCNEADVSRFRGLFAEKRSWLDTPDGERARYRRRSADRVLVHTRLEPRSKNSIQRAEIDGFVEALRQSMGKRTGFKSPVAVELELHATADNPPEIHTVAKNYIDLLYREPAGSGRLCTDDRQIRYLAVSYSLKMIDRPAIIVRADRLSAFHEDVRLAREIDGGSLGGIASRNDDRFDDVRGDLRNWERNREHIVSTYGAATFEAQRRHFVIRDQQNWLSGSERILHLSLLNLLGLRVPVPTESCELRGVRLPAVDFHDVEKRFLLSDNVSLALASLPRKSGEGNQFKQAVENALARLHTATPWLFPLMTELAVAILLVPPIGGGIDLDNLARRIVPRVHSILEPPTAKHSPDPQSIREPKLRRFFDEEARRRRRLPKHHVTRYEVIELARTNSDPPAGSVRLVLCNGFGGRTFIGFVRDIIEKWNEQKH